MGGGLADDIIQGGAGPDEFRTVPLWGVGQRLFFLHDGRTSDLLAAIKDHFSPKTASFPASEANAVASNFVRLPVADQQAILDFVRSL
ncbi:MAG: di-heme oxidoredictase family protein [Methylocella sp.]